MNQSQHEERTVRAACLGSSLRGQHLKEGQERWGRQPVRETRGRECSDLEASRSLLRRVVVVSETREKQER